MKIAAIRIEESMQWRYPCPKWTRIPCVGMVPEIVDGGHSQVADTEQDQNEDKPEKPCERIGQETRVVHHRSGQGHANFCKHKGIEASMNAFILRRGSLQLQQLPRRYTQSQVWTGRGNLDEKMEAFPIDTKVAMCFMYGGLHQKFWAPLSRPIGQLMG